MTDEELDALVVCLRELAMYYEVATEAESAITTLRAQLAEAQRLMRLERTIADKNADRADRAEAALAAQIEADASRAHDHLHDWANDLAWTRDSLIDAQTTGVWNGRRVNDKSWLKFEARMFGERAEAVAESAEHTAADIRNQPHDRSALDRHDAKTREKALREAADAYFIPKFCTDNDREKVEALHAFRAAILALIEVKP